MDGGERVRERGKKERKSFEGTNTLRRRKVQKREKLLKRRGKIEAQGG